ncbi:MAG: rhomboid family intramembrane serine protease [Candidatus Eremiobacteraeota bacterium]|nr:rhomboid family intramembrane serine protease [Candidatus Eremiobacteraeota bacterium]
MIPIRNTRRLPVFPFAVYALVAINVAVFYSEMSLPGESVRDAFINRYALIPYDVTSGVQIAAAPPTLATLVTAQFLHGSFLHIFFNMLFLVVFGPEVEYLAGHARFVAFYLFCGIVGNVAQTVVMPGSHVPAIGASGAIAGILGAYVLRFPTNSVETIVPIGCFPLFLRIPAYLVIGFWAVTQFVHGYGTLSSRVLSEQGGGTAYFAHIGGFLAGVFSIGAFARGRIGRLPRRYRYYL